MNNVIYVSLKPQIGFLHPNYFSQYRPMYTYQSNRSQDGHRSGCLSFHQRSRRLPWSCIHSTRNSRYRNVRTKAKTAYPTALNAINMITLGSTQNLSSRHQPRCLGLLERLTRANKLGQRPTCSATRGEGSTNLNSFLRTARFCGPVMLSLLPNRSSEQSAGTKNASWARPTKTARG